MYTLAFYVQVKKAVYRTIGADITINSMIVDGVSKNSRQLKEGAARWPALDTCYNFIEGEGPTRLHQAIDAWWMRIRNAQAVRNRLMVAKRELGVVIRAVAMPARPVRILSLASGTVQGVIEVAAECKSQGIDIEMMLVDQDLTALHYAESLAERCGVKITTIEGNVLFFTRVINDFQADIVEMMGLLDYLKDGLAIALIRKIRLHLKTGGHFFTCHVHHNAESYFLRHVANWNMLYRTAPCSRTSSSRAGF